MRLPLSLRQLEVPRATERIRVGLPSTAVDKPQGPTRWQEGAGRGGYALMIAEATQDFITFPDALRLGILAKDQLHPLLLTDVIQSGQQGHRPRL